MLKAKWFPHFIAAVLFSLLTLGMTWPLARHLHTHVTPGQQPALTVPYLNLWTLAWNHHWLKGQTSSYWDANIFFPHLKTLAYSEPQLGTALLTFPIVLFGGKTVLAYNLALLVFFFGAALAVYALCWWILGWVRELSQTYRCIAAITSGILYAFTPYMFREIGVLQLLATPFPPLCLLGLHRFFDQKRLSDALLFSASFLGCWYTCAYYGLFLSLFVACFALFFWHRDLFRWRHVPCGLMTGTILIGGLLPLAFGLQSAKVALSLNRSEILVRRLSAVFTEYLQPPSSSLLYEQILGVGSAGKNSFLGGMLLCLASIGAITIFKQVRREQGIKGRSAPLENTDCKTPPINDKMSPSLQRCSIFYAAMAFIALLLSIGIPISTKGLGAYRFLVWISPYNLLYNFVPGFSSIRSPYRFSLFVALFVAILAGVGMLWVCRRVRSPWRWALIITLVSVTIFELWPVPLRLVKVPGTVAELPYIYQQVKKLPSDAVLIEFPLPTSSFERGMEPTSRYMYFSTFHWQKLINGYSGFTPKASSDFVNVLVRSHPQTALSALKAFGVQYVIAHWNDMTEEETVLLQTLEGEGNLNPLFREGNQHTLYQVDRSQHEDTPAAGPDVERVAIYESERHPGSVTLCLYFQMKPDPFLLVTPWKNSIECEISWYKHFGETVEKDSPPILVKKVSYQGSQLLHASSNAIAMDVPMPGPGKYQVVVRCHLLSRSVTKTGICNISPHGFVQFREDP